tara:strand:- start:227 stop:349 length:123 start_codon:yes stop_codon:yes gene_type:complete
VENHYRIKQQAEKEFKRSKKKEKDKRSSEISSFQYELISQ